MQVFRYSHDTKSLESITKVKVDIGHGGKQLKEVVYITYEENS